MEKYRDIEYEAVAVIDSSDGTLYIYDVEATWDSEEIEDFLMDKGFRMSEVSWGVFDGVVNDERPD